MVLLEPPVHGVHARDPGFQDVGPLATYHGEIGREATAVAEMLSHPRPAYHREIGREATAPEHEPAADV